MESEMTQSKRAPRWAWLVATGLGSGRLKPASGTWGSLAALLTWMLFTAIAVVPFTSWAMRNTGQARLFTGYGAMEIATPFSELALLKGSQTGLLLGYWFFELLFLALPILMTWIAVRASDLVVRESSDKDPGYIVADEWAGMWIALWPLRWQLALRLPEILRPGGWRFFLLPMLPFLLFRLFDIWKPWPANQIQILPEGQGIVADDVVAGLYALVLVQMLM